MIRTVARVLPGTATPEGDGFLVHRPFPSRAMRDFDPFLLMDEMGPLELAPNSHQGFPDHPHRGFETVTYLLEGRFEHRDSRGNAGKLNPGDVQWMTAGAGLVHSEMPEREFQRAGGRMHGFQVWVNLPKRDKMMEPRYQEVAADRIPVGRSDDGNVTVRVIAGEALGVHAKIDTRIPIQYLHFTLQPGASVDQPVPEDANAFVYLIRGDAVFGSRRVGAHNMAVFERDGDTVHLEAAADSPEPVELLLLSGKPIGETVVRYGPFVMNTPDEIQQAIHDYQSGKLGTIVRA
jgi:redox-sensitive bicupin YhaK (pirin superfamily)